MQAGRAHLTYCTNVHPGESWAEVRANLSGPLLAVRRRVAAGVPFGVGLRLSARAATELGTGNALEEFVAFLHEHDLYVFTINGFPYGAFHGQPVKAAVYQPDWSHAERANYSSRLARLLAGLPRRGVAGSVSTVPLAFKRHVSSEADIERMLRRLLEHAAFLHHLREETGEEVTLALEPEPCCVLETIDETLAFFERRLLAPPARRELSELAGVSEVEAEGVLRRHLGVCLDACHAAVEFESPDDAVRRLRGAGIRIAKVQLSAGLRVAELGGAALDALREYDEPVYLHQVVARAADGRLHRYADLPDAFTSPTALAASEWRVHFHVPLYREKLRGFVNTQPFLVRLLELQKEDPFTDQLEVETYTWDVLPAEHRGEDVVVSIARELEWVLEQLGP